MAEVNAGAHSAIARYLGVLPSWVNSEDAARLAAYDFYEDLYDNSPAQFRLLLRGDAEDEPIYIPTSKQIVKTLARYVCRDLGFTVTSPGTEGNPAELAAMMAFGDLFTRERLFSKFAAEKKLGLTRGDLCIYVMGDPFKPEGSRLTIKMLDPRAYFPIEDEDDPEKVVGCDIVDQIVEGNATFIRRQRYMKATHPKHPNYNDTTPNYESPVAYESIVLEVTDWEDPQKAKVVRVEQPLVLLPEGIKHLPVYHIKFNERGQNPFGFSVLQGMERLFLAINQGASDEDIALAMAGLGMYASDTTPVDEEGNEVDWVIGPRRVMELSPGGKFERVSGLPNVTPSQEHLTYLKNEVYSTTGINDVALGQVETTVAESGIALRLRLGPILDETDDIDKVVLETLAQFFYDLRAWFAGYEGLSIDETIEIKPWVGDKIPENKSEQSDRLQDLFVNGVISKKFYREELAKIFGFEFPADMDQQIMDEMYGMDPYAQRTDQEPGFSEEPGAEVL